MQVIIFSLIIALSAYIAYQVAILRLHRKIHRKEQHMLKAKLMPSGAEQKRGMLLTKGGSRVISCESKSLSWYARLAQ